ncbi:MAG: 3,4-dihydroxy-2-butanone-4-phosphate synthase [Kofleriaceae bacterium]|nr:3,4-dihydroxy-2-butanone-4-phosphate synthase [Kofleriaceae bacterium]
MNETIEKVNLALDAIRAGKMVILVDDEDRENEGDLVMASEKVTPADINFMATHARGLICMTLTGEMIDTLGLPMMVQNNTASLGTAFTVSIEAKVGVTTGISAADRAVTVQAAVADGATANDLVSPGHVFPLKARAGGVLVRTGQTEGSVDLARLAGLKPSGVICEIMKEDGEMARMGDLEVFAKKHDLLIITVADLIAFRLQREIIVSCKQRGKMRPGFLGQGEDFDVMLYRTEVEDTDYVVVTRGDVRAAPEAGESVLVRVQSMCPMADVFELRPDTRGSMRAIDEAGVGVFLYVYNKGRVDMERAFERQVLGKKRKPVNSGGLSEVLRDFGLGAQVLAEVGCKKIRLMTNSDRKIVGIEGYGIEIVERIAVPTQAGAKVVNINQ